MPIHTEAIPDLSFSLRLSNYYMISIEDLRIFGSTDDTIVGINADQPYLSIEFK
jgi:hypothetical protein